MYAVVKNLEQSFSPVSKSGYWTVKHTHAHTQTTTFIIWLIFVLLSLTHATKTSKLINYFLHCVPAAPTEWGIRMTFFSITTHSLVENQVINIVTGVTVTAKTLYLDLKPCSLMQFEECWPVCRSPDVKSCGALGNWVFVLLPLSDCFALRSVLRDAADGLQLQEQLSWDPCAPLMWMDAGSRPGPSLGGFIYQRMWEKEFHN